MYKAVILPPIRLELSASATVWYQHRIRSVLEWVPCTRSYNFNISLSREKKRLKTYLGLKTRHVSSAPPHAGKSFANRIGCMCGNLYRSE